MHFWKLCAKPHSFQSVKTGRERDGKMQLKKINWFYFPPCYLSCIKETKGKLN